MLTKLSLKNFKSAKNLGVPLANLTVLSGLNGSGKSTVLQSVALIRQSLQYSSDGLKALTLRDNLVQLGTAKDVLCDRADESVIAIELNSDVEKSIIRVNAEGDTDALEVVEPMNPLSSLLNQLRVCPFQFLQADRLTPRTHYDRSDANSRRIGFLGADGEFTPEFLADQGERLEVSKVRCCPMSVEGLPEGLMESIVATPKLYSQVWGWLQQLSPGVKLEATKLSQMDAVSLQYSYASTLIGAGSTPRRPSNVGFGLTYSLPIVVACLAAPEGSLLLLENPEAHLHPRGQAALGALLARCASDGVQIIVETHSDHVLNGIRIAVKKGTLAANQTRICHFTRDPRNGESYVEVPVILPNGELSEWPVGFFDEWDKSLEELLK